MFKLQLNACIAVGILGMPLILSSSVLANPVLEKTTIIRQQKRPARTRSVLRQPRSLEGQLKQSNLLRSNRPSKTRTLKSFNPKLPLRDR